MIALYGTVCILYRVDRPIAKAAPHRTVRANFPHTVHLNGSACLSVVHQLQCWITLLTVMETSSLFAQL